MKLLAFKCPGCPISHRLLAGPATYLPADPTGIEWPNCYNCGSPLEDAAKEAYHNDRINAPRQGR